MEGEERVAGRYVWLWLLGLAAGFFEGAVVVDLRALYYPGGFRFPMVLTWDRTSLVEVAREGASLLLLSAGARLAGRRFLDRFAAFMVLFGVWDLVYYAVLKAVLSWPPSLGTWDVLFLIPVPWLGPVWAPCAVSLCLVAVGSFVYLTPHRQRRVRALDWGIEIAAGLLVVASFVSEWRVVLEGRAPGGFPVGVFAAGLALGLGWFFWMEVARPSRERS